MPEHENLPGETRFLGPPGDSQMIAAMFLPESLDAHTSLAPFRRDDAAAAVRGGFFEARRFGDDEGAECREHFRPARGQHFQQRLGEMRFGHGRDILAARTTGGKQARFEDAVSFPVVTPMSAERGNSRDNAHGWIPRTARFAYNHKFAGQWRAPQCGCVRCNGERR